MLNLTVGNLEEGVLQQAGLICHGVLAGLQRHGGVFVALDALDLAAVHCSERVSQ